jgi:hypothetical protein
LQVYPKVDATIHLIKGSLYGFSSLIMRNLSTKMAEGIYSTSNLIYPSSQLTPLSIQKLAGLLLALSVRKRLLSNVVFNSLHMQQKKGCLAAHFEECIRVPLQISVLYFKCGF